MLKKSIARIKQKDGNTVGVGFLVDECRVLTCSHVIRDALNLTTNDLNEKPESNVFLDFPYDYNKRLSMAKVEYWSPPKSNGGLDVACLDLWGHPPKESCAAPFWETVTSIASLRNNKVQLYGVPPHFDEGIWTTATIVNDRGDGLVQLKVDSNDEVLFGCGFSGVPVWDEKRQSIVGILTTARKRKEAKVAWMIPVYKVNEIWPEIKNQNQQKKIIKIPIVIAAMTENEAEDLFVSSENVFDKLKKSFSPEGLKALQGRYRKNRDDWRPFLFEQRSIKSIITYSILTCNEYFEQYQKTEYFDTRYISDEFFDKSNEERQDASLTMLVDNNGLLVVDLLSLFHPHIRTILAQQVGSEDNIGLLGISPLSRRISNAYNIMEEAIRPYMRTSYKRFSKYDDELCEFGLNNLISIEKWLFHLFKKKSKVSKNDDETRPNPKRIIKFQKYIKMKSYGIGYLIYDVGGEMK